VDFDLQYFVPDIRVASEVSSESATAIEKLGGLPSRLPREIWPKCAVCGKSQSLLAQLSHDERRLDLGRPGRVMFVFQCAHDPGMCGAWDASSGANACIVIEPEDLVDAEPARSDDAPPQDNEVRIVAWRARDDGLPESIARSFFDDASYWALADDVLTRVTWSTRLGGVPRWIQSPSEAMASGWRFVGQLDSAYSFISPPQEAPAWVGIDPEKFEGRTHVAIGPNFGDGGIAYLFLKDTDGVPRGKMLWQCG
jgi:hypothetical protein